jgi:serine/threonine protein kinase
MELLGHTLGPYQVLEKIGRGGMAQVYKGFHPALRRHVAIKLIGQFQAVDPSSARRFQREAQAIAALEHPNIIQIFDSGTQPVGPEGGEAHYLVMEYIQGKDLRVEIDRRRSAGEPFAPDEILHLLSQVADALDYAHGRGVVHRDIKPGNILLTGDGRAILTDFGLAMLRDRASQATLGNSFGTPEYIAPEQAIDSRAAGPRSDIYSLGVILYEMVTGRLPFEDDSPLSLALKHVNEEPVPPGQYAPNLPDAVEGVILQALAKEPDGRFSSAHAMMDALNRAWSGAASHSNGALLHPALASEGSDRRHPLLSAAQEFLLPANWRRRGVLAVGAIALLGLALFGLFNLRQAGGSLALAVATATVSASAQPAVGTPTQLPMLSETPTSTPTAVPSPTHTPAATPTPTSTATLTPTAQPPTGTPTATATPIETATPAPPPAPSETPTSVPSLPSPAAAEDLYNRILFKTDRAGTVQVYSMNPDGTDARPVPNPIIYNQLAELEALSPDGKQEIVVRAEGNAELWLVLRDGSQSEWRVTATAAPDYDPAWSPAGDLIAFVSEQTGNGDIYISAPSGFDMQRITLNEDPYDKHPSWSPDGRYLAFWSNAHYDLRQIYVYDIWSRETHIVGGGPFNDWDPLWVKVHGLP